MQNGIAGRMGNRIDALRLGCIGRDVFCILLFYAAKRAGSIAEVGAVGEDAQNDVARDHPKAGALHDDLGIRPSNGGKERAIAGSRGTHGADRV